MPRLQVGEQGCELDPAQPLLTALQQLGLPVRQACRNGVCGICQCPLLSGQIDYRQIQPRGLNQQELAAGRILPCIAYPVSAELELGEPCYPAR